MDFAQLKTGKFRKNIKTFNLKDSVEKVMCIQRMKAKAQNIEFEVVFENMPNTFICTDEDRLMQVLLGLQSNALKFTSKGFVNFVVKVVEEEQE